MTFHPHVENLDPIPTIELEEKLQRLNKIYFMTDNEQIRLQMILNQEKSNSNIDKLIKVS